MNGSTAAKGGRRWTLDHGVHRATPDPDPELRVAREEAECERKHSTGVAAHRAAVLNRSKEPMVHRMTSAMWELPSFDPFQIFEVTQKKCHILNVHVLRGSNITKGWFNDLMDTPDPYLMLSVKGTPNGKKRTRTIDNCVNPEWNESFQFYLDPSDVHQLDLVLMDANYTLDEEMGRQTVPLDELQLKEKVPKEVFFSNGSKIYFTLEITEDESPDLRYSLALSEEEKRYLTERRLQVLQAIRRLLGEDHQDCPREPREVPVIGLLGSGGGFRAMTSLSGVTNALHDEGVLDCLMYSLVYQICQVPSQEARQTAHASK